MKKNILLLVSVLLIGGCAEFWQYGPGTGGGFAPNTNYILSCLHEKQHMSQEEFSTNFKIAEKRLSHGSDSDKLHFICLSMHEKASYSQFYQGTKILEQYLDEHPSSSEDIYGIQVLSACKSLRSDKKELVGEIESLQKKSKSDQDLIVELQKQIEELKNIENIIKSRETE
jgi:hypothetical protein